MSDSSAVDTLLRAHDLGATVFDTSDIYGLGHSQRLLGRMLAQVPRSSVRITCSVGTYKGTGQHPYSSLNLFRQVEQAQENLGVAHLDVLVLAQWDFGLRDRYLEEARDTLKALRDSGDVTAIGMRMPGILPALPVASGPSGDHSASQPRYDFLFEQFTPQILSTAANPLVQASHHAATRAESGESVFSFARRQGAATMIHEPLLNGLLTGKYGPGAAFSPGDVRSRYTPANIDIINRSLEALRDRFGTDPKALARGALNYCLTRFPDSIVLTGISSPEQAEANYAGFNEMTDADYAFSESTYAALHAELDRQVPPAGDVCLGVL
ncbi:aldo/keto reductase [Streptomyces sp. NPDC055089]